MRKSSFRDGFSWGWTVQPTSSLNVSAVDTTILDSYSHHRSSIVPWFSSGFLGNVDVKALLENVGTCQWQLHQIVIWTDSYKKVEKLITSISWQRSLGLPESILLTALTFFHDGKTMIDCVSVNGHCYSFVTVIDESSTGTYVLFIYN